MAADSECSTSGQSDPIRFRGDSSGTPVVVGRGVKPQIKRFIRQQVRALMHAAFAFALLHASTLQHTVVLQIPDDILLNEDLNVAIAVLPANYNFEVSARLQQCTDCQIHKVLGMSFRCLLLPDS